MKNIFVILLTLLSVVANAGTPPFIGCTSLGCLGKLDAIYLAEDGSVQTPAMGGNTSGLNCTLAPGGYLTLSSDHAHFDKMYAMMLTAHAANKNIYLRTKVGSPVCDVSYAVIY